MLPGPEWDHSDCMHPWRRRVENLIVHEMDREYVLLDGEADRIHQLNSTASAIWRTLGEAGSAEDIAQRLVEEFDVGWEQALSDVRSVLHQLESLSLIVVDSGEQAALGQAEGSSLPAGR